MLRAWMGLWSFVLSSFCSFGLGGCAPSLNLGVPCVLNTDCGADLSCLGGRCRIACRTSRDCAFPLACVDVGNGVTACRVDQDEDGCNAEVCPAPLACRSGVCVDPCASAEECVAENVCNENVCEPAPSIPIGACSPVGPSSGCAAGESCARVGDTYGCTPSASGTLGMRCTAESQCGAGTSCVSGRCIQLCIPGSTSCGLGSVCRAGSDLIGNATGAPIGPPPPVGLGYCTEVCDPLAPVETDGCPDGAACSFTISGTAQDAFFCRSLEEPAIAPFDACGSVDPDLCPAGTICEVGPPSDSTRQCRVFCDPAGAPCADGRTCAVVPSLARPLGVCSR